MNTRPPGSWRRFAIALITFVGVAVGVPATLIIVARVATGAGNPLPGIGSSAEIRDWFGRELSTSEVVPVILRTLLIASWILWAALMSSVLSALAATRPRFGHIHVPRVAMFDGIGIWIATGLTVLSSLAPKVAIADASLPSAFAPTVQVDHSTGSDSTRHVDLVPAGYERVETGESIEMFAQRTLGEESRWTEVWELGRGTIVDHATGATWDEPWRLRGGWHLQLPDRGASATSASRSAVVDDSSADLPINATTRIVAPGESYWSISTDLLLNHLDREPTDVETMALTDTLIDRNAARLGHNEPSMLHPGDVIDIDVDIAPVATPEMPLEHIVVAGDSYWSIATGSLWATSGERPAEADVFLLTQQLMLDNANLLGYEDPAMLHPGDVVRLRPEPTDLPVIETPAPTVDVAVDRPDAETPTEEASVPAVQQTPQLEETAPLPPPMDEAPPSSSRPDVQATPPAGQRMPSIDTAATISAQPNEGRSVAPVGVLAGLSMLSAAGVASLLRKRHAATRQRLRPGRRLAEPDPATRSAIDDVLYRDVSDVRWMDQELRLLAHLLDPAARRGMSIELVQLGSSRTLEVAFKEVVEVSPPEGWKSVADRVWRLDGPHDESLLAEVQDAPPVAPTLVTLGVSTDSSQIYLNLESAAGINLVGDESSVHDWLANVLWEIGGEAIGEGSTVRLVSDEPFDAFSLPDGVEQISEPEALAVVAESFEQGATNRYESMLHRRTGRWESWPSTSLVLVGEANDERWDEVAAEPSIVLISMTRRFEAGLDVAIHDGIISIPALGIEQPVCAITEAQQLTIDDVMDSVGLEATEEVLVTPAPSRLDEVSAEVETDENWEPPTWPVMINVLGTPHATKNGSPVKLTPQQLSALALIAMKREIPAHDFRRSIWGDEDDVSPERVRDMLSQLRKKVGGLRVIPKREDGLVCAGEDLGSDTLVFESLLARSVAVPAEQIDRLSGALDLVSGRIMDYSSSDASWWRWTEIAFGATDWTAKTTGVAASLARCRLDSSDPAAARDIAERGLVADPLNASLTELLMESYSALGTLESAQRVYESHDRSLDRADLGGASADTRRVLERLQSAVDRPIGAKARVS